MKQNAKQDGGILRRPDNEYTRAVLFAIVAAALYAFSAPLSKMLLSRVSPVLLAGLLYIGAGIGAGTTLLIGYSTHKIIRLSVLTKHDILFVTAMILLDVLAPVLLLLGLRHASASNAALLNNFEIVATALFALLLFRERISRRLWSAIVLITSASCLLTLDIDGGFSFSIGSFLILMAAACWGLENNCTRMLSDKNPIQIVTYKGIGSGVCALAIGLLTGEEFPVPEIALIAMLVGSLTYGASIACYIRAQRTLGAAKTSAYYAASPFIGSGLSFLLLGERLSVLFFLALVLMLAGAYFATFDRPAAWKKSSR